MSEAVSLSEKSPIMAAPMATVGKEPVGEIVYLQSVLYELGRIRQATNDLDAVKGKDLEALLASIWKITNTSKNGDTVLLTALCHGLLGLINKFTSISKPEIKIIQDYIDIMNFAIARYMEDDKISNNSALKKTMSAAEKLEIKSRMNLLTKRQHEVLNLIISEAPNKVIAHNMGISVKTVELHRSEMMRKMKVKSVAGLVKIVLSVESDI